MVSFERAAMVATPIVSLGKRRRHSACICSANSLVGATKTTWSNSRDFEGTGRCEPKTLRIAS